MCGSPSINAHFTESSCHPHLHPLPGQEPSWIVGGTGKGGGRASGAPILVLGVPIRLGLLAELLQG